MAELQLVIPPDRSASVDRHAPPDRYLGLSDEEMERRIGEARAALGRRVVILGHHYQRDEVIKFADYTGDSLRLSRQAASRPEAEFIVFCGVHFMAEAADILSSDHQQVLLPDLAAGCSMADMATAGQVETCWQELADAGVTGVVPVTYINSSAAIKAFCGARGGLVCTSSNARAALEWAFERGRRILFLPDQHLGRNTGYKMGIPLDQMMVWDPDEPGGGIVRLDGDRPAGEAGGRDPLGAARLILWKGCCSVHMRFSVDQIERMRTRYPSVRIIVHPECTWDVVQAADDSGSTEYIIRTVTEAPKGTTWGVGTEIHLVNRLARILGPDKTVMSLEPFGCLCSTMYRISPNHLLWALEELVAGHVRNRIEVPAHDKHFALEALNRMLAAV
jgi:quinolinate synthase